MSYTKSLNETQSENLDVRILEIVSNFGGRNIDTMQWTFDNHNIFRMARALLDSEEARILAAAPRADVAHDVKALASRFLGWPLPKTVCADGCATNSSYAFPRSGTNLLNADEAEEMLRYVLAGHEQKEWQTGVPPTKHNDYKEYIVAVRRAHAPEKVYVFAANYANNYDDELHDQDGNRFVAHGWYDVNEDTSGEFDNMFSQTLQEGDEVLGWQHLPKYRT